MTTVTFRNGTTVSDGSDEATTLRNGGHRTRFVPALVGTVEAASEAKGWASLLGAVVYDSEYSAKEYAIGTTCPSGSAKSWASGTGVVAGGLYSAKYYMEQAQTFSNSAINAPGTSATSTTSVTIGTGSKTFTIQTGKAFSVGQFVVVSDQTTPANYMVGQVTAHNSSTGSLVISVSSTGGSGTLANWVVSLTALANVAGAATLGGNNIYSGTNTYNAAVSMTGALDVSGTTNFTGTTNLKGTTTIYKASGSVLLTAQTLSNTLNDFASYSLKTGSNEVKFNLEASTGTWTVQDVTNTRDLLSYVPGTDKVVLRKPQRTDAATSANDLVRKAELDNASVQSIVTTTQGALSGFRNRVINGDARVRQRGAPETTTYTAGSVVKLRGPVDCFYSHATYISASNSIQMSSETFNSSEDPYYVKLTANGAVQASGGFPNSWGYSGITTVLEDHNVYDLTNTACILSFKFKAQSAGDYSVTVAFSDNKVFVTKFTYVSGVQIVTIPLPAVTGTVFQPNGSGFMAVSIGGYGGSGFSVTQSSSWQTYTSTLEFNARRFCSGVPNWAGAGSSAYISVTDLQLEKGSVATPFERRPYQVELALCQRYYETGYFKHWGSAAATGHSIGTFMPFKVQKRIAPTSIGTSGASGTPVFETINKDGTAVYFNSTTVGTNAIEFSWTASAEF